MTKITALTVWQPWAALIVYGCKPFEFRVRATALQARPYVGQRIAIHAGKRPAELAEIETLIGYPDDLQASLGTADPDQFRKARLALLHMRAHLQFIPHSCIVGTVIVGEPKSCAEQFGPMADPEMWCIPMLEPRPILEPPYARGHQGFWTYDGPLPDSPLTPPKPGQSLVDIVAQGTA